MRGEVWKSARDWWRASGPDPMSVLDNYGQGGDSLVSPQVLAEFHAIGGAKVLTHVNEVAFRYTRGTQASHCKDTQKGPR